MNYLIVALLVVLVFVVWWRRMLTLDGIVVAVAEGAVIYWAFGWAGLAVILTFFPALAGLATLWGQEKKIALGLKDEASRDWKAVLSNGAIPALVALGFAVYDMNSSLLSAQFLDAWYIWVYVAVLAGAAADTVSAELGKLWVATPVLITTMKPVKAGTNGAVSPEGTLAGLVASALVAFVALVVGFIGFRGFLVVVIVATLINVLDSLIGATMEGTLKVGGRAVFGNNMTNVVSMLIGALVCFGVWLAIGKA